jgi:hypothetical protein
MATIRYCPRCEGIITEGSSRCVLCGADLDEHAPLVEAPSLVRERARAEAQRETHEPSKVLGVVAWIAELTGGALLAIFCILPAIAFVLGFLIFLVRALIP